MNIIEKYEKKLTKLLGEKITIQADENDEGLDAMEFGAYQEGLFSNQVAHFEICQLPGCCGVAVSYEATVIPFYRKKGVGTLLNQFRIEWARGANYGLLICTDIDIKGGAQEKIMKKNEWGELIDFVNPKTKNRVKMYAIKL